MKELNSRLVTKSITLQLTPAALDRARAELPESPADYRDPSVTWEEDHAPGAAGH